MLTTFTSYDAQDVAADRRGADDRAGLEGGEGEAEAPATPATAACFDAACASGYTFFRRDTPLRSTADQTAPGNEWVYVVYDPTMPGTQHRPARHTAPSSRASAARRRLLHAVQRR